MELNKDGFQIASDVNKRDGIGVEVYRDNKLKIEIFRDDTKKVGQLVYSKKINL